MYEPNTNPRNKVLLDENLLEEILKKLMDLKTQGNAS